ncbi:unnamed protein product, partial [marine sediment metagenome]
MANFLAYNFTLPKTRDSLYSDHELYNCTSSIHSDLRFNSRR